MKVPSRFKKKIGNQTWSNAIQNLKKTINECYKKIMKSLWDSKSNCKIAEQYLHLTSILKKKINKGWWRGCMGGG